MDGRPWTVSRGTSVPGGGDRALKRRLRDSALLSKAAGALATALRTRRENGGLGRYRGEGPSQGSPAWGPPVPGEGSHGGGMEADNRSAGNPALPQLAV